MTTYISDRKRREILERLEKEFPNFGKSFLEEEISVNIKLENVMAKDLIPEKIRRKTSVFVTTMYRYGDKEKHSYVLGVWSSHELAMGAGQTESLWRGGKYEPEVTEWKVDANEFDNMGEEIINHCEHVKDGEYCPYCKE